jgi:Na+-transporting methylmalonyl-CoA/oxaloacetate decarboxylase gamma subunit
MLIASISVPDVEYQAVGIIVVLACLSFLAIILSISAKICSTIAESKKAKSAAPAAKPAPAAPAQAQPESGALTPELVAVISAAISTVLEGMNHRIVDIQPHNRSYSASGRSEIFASHRIRTKN